MCLEASAPETLLVSLTWLLHQASAWMQPALAKKLARRFGEEATKEVLLSTVLPYLTCKTEAWPNT